MAIYRVNSDGKAPKGLKAGDTVVTGGGTYKINSVNSDGSYNSSLASKYVTTRNYTGGYASAPSSSSGSKSSSGGSSGGSSGVNSQYTTKYASTGGDIGLYGKQLMESGASADDVKAVWLDRANKIANDSSLSQYQDDEIQQAMWDYIMNEIKSDKTSQEEYQEDWEDQYAEEKPTYESQYNPAIEAMLNKILNRDDFSYDALSDPLYQQYVEQSRREGDRAMRDTMAEVAASAGGMNSYAITAAQQANDYYNAQLGDKIPELYQLAYQMYLNDKASMVEDLGLLQSMDSTQYNRYRDTMSDYYADKNFAYGLYKDAVEQGNFDKEFAYNQLIGDRDYNHMIGRENITDSRYDAEWENTLNRQDVEDSRYNDALAREDEEKAKAQALEEVWALLQVGKMPSDELLARAGMDATTASAYLAGLKEQEAKALASSNGGGGLSSQLSSKGGSSVDDLVSLFEAEDEPKDKAEDEPKDKAEDHDWSDNPSERAGQATAYGMESTALLAKAREELKSPNLTLDSLFELLDSEAIYIDKDGKFRRDHTLGMGIS